MNVRLILYLYYVCLMYSNFQLIFFQNTIVCVCVGEMGSEDDQLQYQLLRAQQGDVDAQVSELLIAAPAAAAAAAAVAVIVIVVVSVAVAV